MKFYKSNKKHCCATVAVDGEFAIGDPCYLIPHWEPGDPKWEEVCAAYSSASNVGEYSFTFRGVKFDCRDTGGDGFFDPGVAIDTGAIAKCNLADLRAAFPSLALIEI